MQKVLCFPLPFLGSRCPKYIFLVLPSPFPGILLLLKPRETAGFRKERWLERMGNQPGRFFCEGTPFWWVFKGKPKGCCRSSWPRVAGVFLCSARYPFIGSGGFCFGRPKGSHRLSEFPDPKFQPAMPPMKAPYNSRVGEL